MINLYGQEITKLEKLLMDRGQKKYRATQLFTWIYEKKAKTFDEMSDVSLKFRAFFTWMGNTCTNNPLIV